MQRNKRSFDLLIPFFKPYWLLLTCALLMVPLSSFTFSAQPFLIQKAIDNPLKTGDYQGLLNLVLLLIVMVVINFVAQIIQFSLINLVGQNIVTDIRKKLFIHLEYLSMNFFDRTPVGRSVSRITNDMEQLAESFAGGVVLVVMDIFNILGILIFMFYLNWQLSLVVGFFLIPIYWATVYYQEKFRQANLKARAELSELNSFLQQNIVGIMVVQALNSAKKSMQKFSVNNKKYFDANDSSIKADSQLSALIELVSILALLAMIYLCSKLLSGLNVKEVSIGVVLAFLQYTQSLFEPIRNLSDRFTIVQSAFTATERINELLDEKSEVIDPVNPIAIGNLQEKKLITFDNVWFKYQKSSDEKSDSPWVLQGFSLEIDRGKKIALVGRTGCGKSTMIKLLTRLYDPQQGEIFFNGHSLKNYLQQDLHRKVAVLHQDSYTFAGTLRDNIKLNRDESLLDWDFIKPLLKIVNLDLEMILSERAGNISSGEEQVINFARALITKPEVLILDEATAKIDVKTESVIQQTLHKFLENRTAIIIAHRLETICSCDEIVFLKDGKVFEKGSHLQLLDKQGLYFDYYREFVSE